MIPNYENVINAICDRFQNHITPLKIVNWLDNFERADWTKALIVLNSFEYYTTQDIIKEFDNSITQFSEEKENSNPIHAIPVGNAGKSGLAMIYFLKKTNCFVQKKIKILHDFGVVQEGDNILMVDDFSGSGKTILDFYNSIKNNLPNQVFVSAITVAHLSRAKVLLERNGINIYGNLRLPAFSKRGSVFGYFPRMKALREFCFKYGNLLYPEQDYIDKKTKQHPLGYINSQALIGFEHAVPNNTLSIIWSDRKRNDLKTQWYPIFPRRSQAYIKEASDFKKTSAYWISLLYKLKLESSFGFDSNKYTKYNLRVLSVIILKLRRRSQIIICQFLGINLDEYQEIIEDCIRREILNDKGELTTKAIKVVEEIRKKIKFETDNYIKPELIIEEDMVYVPKTFLGSS